VRVYSYVPGGYAGDLVSVEVDIRRGIPTTEIVGLPDNAVREARERVRVAIRKSGLDYPQDRVLVNLAPAGVRKVGAAFDLAIAVGILQASGQLGEVSNAATSSARVLALGELQLDGTVRPVRGVLSAVASALEDGILEVIVPTENLAEARALRRGRIEGAESLLEAVEILAGGRRRQQAPGGETPYATSSGAGNTPDADLPDFSQLRGQSRFKRALEVAAAGRHNLLTVGPPGSGKTMGVRALPSIIPDLTEDDALEVTRIYSRAGLLQAHTGLVRRPPFRSPHHTASLQGIVGGGAGIMPGEISLAHRGVLFLDEAAEFRKHVLQSLREPTEERRIVIARAGRTYWYPANFQLVLAANPCPCGYFGHPTRPCTCTMGEIQRYWKRLGGPLMDRVDLRVRVDPEAATAEGVTQDGEADAVRHRVLDARRRQRHRYGGEGYSHNAEMPASKIAEHLRLRDEDRRIVEEAAEKLALSSRAVVSVLRMARSIADLDGAEQTRRRHLLEAVQHRRLGEGGHWL
jgi:magnesium chelatase family protein